MKNIKSILLIVLLVFFASCYKDKGNYKYKEISEVEIQGFATNGYTRVALLEGLNIEPEVITDLKDDQLSFTWEITKVYRTENVSEVEVELEEIGTGKNLSIPIIALEPGDYLIFYKIGVENSDRYYQASTTLRVTTQYSVGFYVMKQVSAGVELDLHFIPERDEQGNVIDGAEPAPPITNLLTALEGAPMPGEPVSFGLTFAYSFFDEEIVDYSITRTINPCTTEGIRVYDTRNMAKVYDYKTIFVDEIPNEKPYYMRAHAHGASLMTEGGHYFSYQYIPYLLGSGKFGMANDVDGGFVPSKHCMFLSDQPSEGAPAGLYMFDELNGRFVTVDFNGNHFVYSDNVESGQVGILPRGINDKMLFYGGNRMGETLNSFAIFEKKGETDQRIMYLMNPNNSNTYNPIKEVRVLAKGTAINNASMYATNEIQATVIYCLYQNQVHMYNPAANTSMQLSLEGLDATEEITFIGHRFYQEQSSPNEQFNYFVVATQSGSSYKIHLYNIVGGTPIGLPKQILKGEGKMFGLHYISNVMTSNSYEVYSGAM